MPKVSQLEYGLQELTELMVRDRGITKGHWMILVRFTWAAANLETGPQDVAPALISRIQSIGIQEVPTPNPISVDASQLNKQEPRATAKSGSRKAKARQ